MFIIKDLQHFFDCLKSLCNPHSTVRKSLILLLCTPLLFSKGYKGVPSGTQIMIWVIKNTINIIKKHITRSFIIYLQCILCYPTYDKPIF